MTNALTVFATGICGVFLGMAFLYLSIRITGVAVKALEKPKAAPAVLKERKEA